MAGVTVAYALSPIDMIPDFMRYAQFSVMLRAELEFYSEAIKLNIKDKLKTIRDNYVINQVKNIEIPNFETDRICRYRYTFSGRVQKVGFRLEVFELAKRLGLTGFCINCSNGDVLVELQGCKNRIDYLVCYMESLKRIRIKNKSVEELKVDTSEKVFLKR